MTAAWYRLLATPRTRWKAAVALVILAWTASAVVLAVVLVAPLVPMTANVVAFVPGRIAAGLRPGALRRSE